MLPRDLTVDLTALFSTRCIHLSRSLPFLLLFFATSRQPGRERERERDCALVTFSLLLSFLSIPLSIFVFLSLHLPHGQRGHVPVAMETGPNRDGNSPPLLSISLFLLFPVFLRRAFSSSRIPLSNLLLCSDRARAFHLSLIQHRRTACFRRSPPPLSLACPISSHPLTRSRPVSLV